MNTNADEEALTALYAQRQELLRQLTEIDAKIRVHESQLHEHNGHVDKIATGESTLHTGNGTSADKIGQLLARSMRDAAGLRDALKLVDACRNVQDMHMRDGSATDKIRFRNVFVHEVLSHAAELAMDANGSELMQHLIVLLSSGTAPAVLHEVDYDVDRDEGERRSELMLLMHQLKDSLVAVGCNTNGTRMSQRLIDSLTTLKEFKLLTSILSPSMVELATDINGNHAVAKLLTSSRFKRLACDVEEAAAQAEVKEMYEAVYAPIAEHCMEICRNRQGCCIIQKCLLWSPEPFHTTIMNTVLNNTLKLVQDPFGNYVVQFILDRQRATSTSEQTTEEGEAESVHYTNQIIRQMLHHVAELSCNKFSSNVIEKCLKTASPEVRQLLVDELTDPQVLPKLLTDSFANYVIQTAIATAADDAQFTQLRDSIMPLQNLLRNSPYGVKIEAKLSRRYRESTRRQARRKEVSVSQQMAPMQHEACLFSSSFLPNMPGPLPMMAPDAAAMAQQPMTFAKITADMGGLFQAQPMPQGPPPPPPAVPPPPHQGPMMNSMPFMLQGPQGMVSITGSQPPFTMNVLNGNGMTGEYR